MENMDHAAEKNNSKFIPGSNLGPETGYPDRIFVDFLSPSRLILG
jgi:hypothetical protein